MGFKLIGSINLGQFRDTFIQEFELPDGDKEECLVIPIKRNGFLKRKSGIYCKLLASEIKKRLFFYTHVFVAVKHRKDYKTRKASNDEILDDNIILGSAYAKSTTTNYDNIGAPPVTVKRLQNMDFGDDNEVDI